MLNILTDMSVEIRKVTDKETLRKFVQFGIDLYEGNEYFVPPLIYDEMATLNPKKKSGIRSLRCSLFSGLS
jgi:hypothetical protein